MPQLPSGLAESVFYLYQDEAGALTGKPFGGTGFFVGYPTGLASPAPQYFIYAVTNWHVAVRDGFPVIRVNKHGGGVDVFPLDCAEWDFRPGWHDIAIAEVSLSGIHEYTVVNLDMLLTEEDVHRYFMKAGEDVFMVGRFVDHDGATANVPAVRFGNISTMPQPIKQVTGASDLGSFILDMHSRTGYSGSPVYVYRTRDHYVLPQHVKSTSNVDFIALLGIHWGQFPELWEVKSDSNPLPQVVSLSDDAKYIKGMSGMTMVIPAWAIREMLEMPKFQERRKKRLAEIAREHGPDMSPVAESNAERPSDSNPEHREAFNRLLGAAAKTKRQDG
jgi:hypothetical protein